MKELVNGKEEQKASDPNEEEEEISEPIPDETVDKAIEQFKSLN